ncbi:MAG TPA: 2,4-diaminopentanoate dehydrogenase [Bellilinea sp.]|nr:2,4-diaminopentanoate dehydrogenase [Bellilinea sp.]
MNKIRVLLWGIGAMGSGMGRLILEKEGLEIVAAIDTRPEYVGKDLGEALKAGKSLGVTVTDNPESVLDATKVDIVLIATTSWVKDQISDLRKIVNAGIDCISIAEEMADSYAQSPELSKELDALCKEKGVTVLGTGVNPGFVLDLLVIALTGGNHAVERIEASRVNDLSPYGPTVMQSQGVGTTPEQFTAGVADGSIVGHVGFPESVHMISDALGLGVDRIEQSREPILSNVYRETPFVKVEAGMVAGCRHVCIGFRGDKEVVRLVHPQQIHPHLENQDTGDYINIYGKPEIHMSVKPEIAGGIATQGLAVNMIPHVVAATPGLKRMIDLPVPAALMGESAYKRNI